MGEHLGKLDRHADFRVSADPNEVLRLLGYRRNKKPNGALAELVQESEREAETLVRPSGVFSLFEMESFPKGSFLSGMFADKSPAIKIALAVCTIGPKLEEIVSNYSSSGQLTRALIIDAAGSSLTEAACDFVNEKICQRAVELSLHPAARISPGYGHWKIEEQGIIFELLPTDSIGVSLTDSYVMIPRKSVSFAVKLLREPPPDSHLTPGEKMSACKGCGRKNCQFRREQPNTPSTGGTT